MIRKSGNRFSEKIMLKQKGASASPANALTRHDEGGVARRVGAAAEEPPGGDDQDQQRKDCDQIDPSGVVTPVADFPAHCF
jgi:hypothetical protein